GVQGQQIVVAVGAPRFQHVEVVVPVAAGVGADELLVVGGQVGADRPPHLLPVLVPPGRRGRDEPGWPGGVVRVYRASMPRWVALGRAAGAARSVAGGPSGADPGRRSGDGASPPSGYAFGGARHRRPAGALPGSWRAPAL